jgi:hypothetical protein
VQAMDVNRGPVTSNMAGRGGSAAALLLLLLGTSHRAACHPQYLDEFPNGHNAYFSSLPGEGAVGHSGDKSGARLNSFGHEYPGGDLSLPMPRREVRRFQSCSREDYERVELNHADDDDDDHHHHHGAVWTLKFCCGDPDLDGQWNGWELGDPCCVWKKGRQAANTTDISHPARITARTKRAPCLKPICGRTPPLPPSPPPSPPPRPRPPGPPGPPPTPTPTPPGPPIPGACLKALDFECQTAQKQGFAACLVCAGEHEFILKQAGCTQTNFETYCHANTPSPTPPPPAPSPPSAKCDACVAAKRVWCWRDQTCWLHGASGDRNASACPTSDWCASDMNCRCTSCADTSCQHHPPPVSPPVGNHTSTAEAAGHQMKRGRAYVQGRNARQILGERGVWWSCHSRGPL